LKSAIDKHTPIARLSRLQLAAHTHRNGLKAVLLCPRHVAFSRCRCRA
jgi:hypothetical protein